MMMRSRRKSQRRYFSIRKNGIYLFFQNFRRKITAVAIYRGKIGFLQFVSIEKEREAVKLSAQNFDEIYLPGSFVSVKYSEGKITELEQFNRLGFCRKSLFNFVKNDRAHFHWQNRKCSSFSLTLSKGIFQKKVRK